mgnify:CR=1 FL=1
MKILIIEDEKGIINFLKQGLEEEGFTVSYALDGIEGLEKVFEENPNLILLDWMLPKLQGINVCKEIRKKNNTTPILFLTAKDTIQDTIEGLKAGANDYIKKPFSFEELLERIKVYFRNNNHNQILYLSNISLNPNTYQVFVDNAEVSFTQKEFELLKYLIENKGKVCNRNNIIEDVWNIHFEYDTGVIDVFMNAIRKKLNLSKDQDIIKTIRGVGYIAND